MPPNPINLISTSIRTRSRQLRRTQTPAEKILWRALKNRQLGGYKFRRQHPIGTYIGDFYCAQAKLIIELDGGSHKLKKEYDDNRTIWLESRGYQVLCFRNHPVVSHLDLVTNNILNVCSSKKEKMD